MAKKKRAPLEQLKAAGRIARQMLVEKGLIAKESRIDKILQDKAAPVLPGIPVYLPHPITLKISQRMMYDFLLLWKDECKENEAKAENITEFFKFIIKEFRMQDKKFRREMKEMEKTIQEMKDVPVLKEVFSPVRKKEIEKALQRFFIDSLAVAVALKSNHTTSDYANWFLDWTQDLYTLWVAPEDKEKLVRI